MNRNFPHRVLSLLLCLTLSISLIVPALADDTSGDASGGGSETALESISVTLSYTELSLSSSDSSLTATITAAPVGATLPDSVQCTWSSDDTSIATVTSTDSAAAVSTQDPGTATTTATVSPVATGTAGITCVASVTIGDQTYTSDPAACTVTVPGLTLNKSSLSLYTRDSATLTASVYGDDIGDVSWSSSNDSIVTVSDSGTVTAVSAGSASITAAAGDYSASCTVNVSEATASVIKSDADTSSPLSFSSIDSAIDDQCRDVLNSSLDYVTGLSVSTSAGILYYGYVSEAEPGAGVGTNEKYYYSGNSGSRSLSDVAFVPKDDFSGNAVIQYMGYDSAGDFFNGTIRVSVEATSVISYSATGQNQVDFQVSDFSTVCQDKTGHELQFVTFSLPSSSKGTLYYNYSGSSLDNTVSEETSYYRSKSPNLSNVSFVPTESYAGTVTIDYEGTDTSGDSYSGRVEITVSSSKGGSGDISYSTKKNKAVTFDVDDFDDVCEDETDYHLDYVRFTLPSSSKGTLYYNYSSSGDYDSKVSSSRKYYRSSSPRLNNVSFVPHSNWTGTVEIDFTGYSTDGDRFSGTVEVTVKGTSSSDISYSTKKNKAVTFDVDDFDDVCEDETDYHLDYVRFTLPSSSKGTLYYNYSSSGDYDSKVSSSRKYYRSSSPRLNNVSFVPHSSWTGTVEIDFTGYSTDGDHFSGTVEVTVKGTSSSDISYSTNKNKAVAFDVDDFDEICEDETDYHLDYVRFTLPSSSKGTLYYDYSSSGDYDSKVSSSRKYYRSSSPYLDDVSFVPYSNWTGTVEIDFTGYSTDGDHFSGTVEVTVKGTSSSDISYSTNKNKAVAFDVDDFDEMCKDETNYHLNYVRFTLPSSSKGTLYYNYTSSGDYDSKVSSSKSYYRSSNLRLDNVSFVPYSNWTGTVDIDFTGYSTDGDRFSGTVEVTVKGTSTSNAGTIYYTTMAGTPVKFQISSFQTACSGRGEGSFSSAIFALPSASAGQLCFNYVSASQPGTAVLSVQSYYASSYPAVSGISFVPTAGYAGTVSLSYTGRDSDDNTYAGIIVITVAPSASVSSSFTDMGGYAWAASSVEYLHTSGVVYGTGSGKYSPSTSINRGNFILMLCRAFKFNRSGGTGFSDVSSGSYYDSAVRTAQAMGIAQGSGGKFYPDRALSREEAAVFLLRALRADGWTIEEGQRSSLTSYVDSSSVSEYAVGAVSAMVRLGVLQGDTSRHLNPQSTLTRAEMAVILHRAMTL
ncbi:MAG: S-layer homology domain-containing protein [Intestinimonas sp.]|jgi:hypothetical protein|nr:S-layer homology domain-containing protein [Intestinimonas sp.]